MNLLEQTKELCRLYNIKPARSKGQNFLIKEEIYDKIIETAELKPDDVVLEVGPGLGFLTVKLAARVKKVIAVELDDKLAGLLRKRLLEDNVENVKVVNENILDFNFQFPISNFQTISNFQFPNKSKIQNLNNFKDPNNPKNSKFKVVANLPYNITSIFLRKFLAEIEYKPELMVLMLQQEVAERLTAKPGKMSLLAVSVQFYAEPEIIDYVAKENFWPQPEVDSAIIKIKPHLRLPLLTGGINKVLPLAKEETPSFVLPFIKGEIKRGCVDKERDFFRLVKFGFSSKRKMLKNNLAAGYKISSQMAENKLKKVGFNPKIRAEELAVEDWLKLFGEFRQNML